MFTPVASTQEANPSSVGLLPFNSMTLNQSSVDIQQAFRAQLQALMGEDNDVTLHAAMSASDLASLSLSSPLFERYIRDFELDLEQIDQQDVFGQLSQWLVEQGVVFDLPSSYSTPNPHSAVFNAAESAAAALSFPLEAVTEEQSADLLEYESAVALASGGNGSLLSAFDEQARLKAKGITLPGERAMTNGMPVKNESAISALDNAEQIASNVDVEVLATLGVVHESAAQSNVGQQDAENNAINQAWLMHEDEVTPLSLQMPLPIPAESNAVVLASLAETDLDAPVLAEVDMAIASSLTAASAMANGSALTQMAVPASGLLPPSPVMAMTRPGASQLQSAQNLQVGTQVASEGVVATSQAVEALAEIALKGATFNAQAGLALASQATPLMSLQQKALLAEQQQQALVSSEKAVEADEAMEEGEMPLVVSPTERKSASPMLASIAYPLRHPQWGAAVAKRIVFMANQQMQQAQITLNPEKLGPIQIRLHLDRDQSIAVSMSAQHGATREALEQAMPRLKEMLTEAGIAFSSVEVDDDAAFSEQQSNKQAAKGAVESLDESVAETVVQNTNSKNMIDFYA